MPLESYNLTAVNILLAVFRVHENLTTNHTRSDVITDKTGGPPAFSSLILLTQAYYILNAFNILLAVIRVLGFLRVNHNLSMLTDTFALMVKEILQVCVCARACVVLAFLRVDHFLCMLIDTLMVKKFLQDGWCACVCVCTA